MCFAHHSVICCWSSPQRHNQILSCVCKLIEKLHATLEIILGGMDLAVGKTKKADEAISDRQVWSVFTVTRAIH